MKIKALLKLLQSMGAAAIPDPDGMTAMVSGSAVAIGESTLATGQVQNQMVDKGAYSVAQGSATFLGVAQSANGGLMAAGANTQADVLGADLVLTITRLKSVIGADGVSVQSTTKFVAIDIDGWAPAGGQVTIDIGSLKLKPGHLALTSGNVAHVTAGANAVGDNSLAATTTDALVIDNHFSAVSAVALTGIA